MNHTHDRIVFHGAPCKSIGANRDQSAHHFAEFRSVDAGEYEQKDVALLDCHSFDTVRDSILHGDID
jgi:hypothetical protein